MPPFGSWFRPPRHVLTLFLGVTGALSVAMAWLAWQLMAGDQAVAAQRAQGRLDNAAETAVATLRHGLDDIAARLDTLSTRPIGEAPADLSAQAPGLENDAVLILIGDRTVDVWPDNRLVYYPPAALRRPAAEATTDVFAVGETLEFQRRDFAGALRAYGLFARSANPEVRAGALLRTARIRLWSLNQPDRALAAYDELAALEAALADDQPAGLQARYGRCLVFQNLDRQEDLRREAAVLERDLGAATWRVTQAQYEFYRDAALAWQPQASGSDSAKAPPNETEALSAAVTAMWDEWETARASAAPAAGTTLVPVDGVSVLVAWRSAERRVAALVGGPSFIDARLVAPGRAALTRYRASLVLTGPDGPTPVRNQAGSGERQVHRAAAETRLPWSVSIADADPGGEMAATAAQRRVVLAGLVALGLFVLAGSAFIVRAVNREVEVSRLQTDFVAAVSHEFRTPLTSIAQVSEALLEGRVPEGRREEYYRMQQRDSERLQRLVESLLDFGRMESGAREYRLEPVEVTVLVRALAGEFAAGAQAAGFRVETDLQSEGAFVSTDRDALGRAIWNLLDNAVKYSPSCKTVWLRTVVRDGSVDISVQDRGVGVPAADQLRIFDKFARGANAAESGAKGTGLGLAMVRHIVAAHGGHVRLESFPGDGSTFTITLPLVHQPESPRPSGASSASHPDR